MEADTDTPSLAEDGVDATAGGATQTPRRAVSPAPSAVPCQRAGRYSDFPADLDPRLGRALRARGIGRLYVHHQREAWESVAETATP